MQRESVSQSLLVATCLCIVCSVLVSSAAVLLKDRQEANKLKQIQRDVLTVAGLYQEGEPILEQFKQVDKMVVDLETGEYVDAESLDPKAVDMRAAAKDPDWSVAIEKADDLAKLKRREKYSTVFLVNSSDGQLQQLILPVRGKGLWSTMYGFLALKPDCRTVLGITFYEHGETPGLGGEIESDKFKRQWKEKLVRDEDGTPHFDFVRGVVDSEDPAAKYKIDGIAGATITTRGVADMIRFWMGPQGFKPYLDRMSEAETTAGTAAHRLQPDEHSMTLTAHESRAAVARE